VKLHRHFSVGDRVITHYGRETGIVTALGPEHGGEALVRVSLDKGGRAELLRVEELDHIEEGETA